MGQEDVMAGIDHVAARSMDPTADVARSRAGLVWAGWAGIAGPVLFTITFMALELVRGADFDSVRLPVSALEAGRYGSVQQVSFVIFGALTIVFAVGLHRGLRPSRWGIVGPALFGLSGAALVGAGVFPLEMDAAGQVRDPGGHSVAGFVFFLASALALVVLSRRVAADPAWSRLAGVTLAAGVVCLVGFVVMGALVIPDEAPLHDWAGLGQRAIILLALFPARVALGLRLLRTARSGARG
jgi:hypothetical membrane protein